MRFALLLPAFLLVQDAVKTPLEWKLAKGASPRYEFGFAFDMDLGGLPVKQELLLGLAMDVVAVDENGVADIKAAIDRAKIDAEGVLETEYDSDVDEDLPDDSIGRFIAGLPGGSFTLKMDRRGRIVEVKGIDAILKAAGKGREKGGVIRQLKNLLADGQFQRLLQLAVPVLPEAPVAKGDSWKSDLEWAIPMFGTVSMKNVTTLREIRAGKGEADLRQEGKTEVVSEKESMWELTEAASKAEYVWLVDRGLLQSGASTIKLTLAANGQEYAADIKTSMKLAPRDGPPKKAPKPPPKLPPKKEEKKKEE